ncbi:hypothetical protein [Streptomyces tricolor]
MSNAGSPAATSSAYSASDHSRRAPSVPVKPRRTAAGGRARAAAPPAAAGAAPGGWGDLVAPTKEIAEKAVAKAGITVHESFDGEFAAKVTTGTYEWKRMAGIQIGG